jgi:hypothetical protein
VSVVAVSHPSEEPIPDSITANTAEERWQLAKACEIDLYRKAREEAHDLGLSDEETAQQLQPHVARLQHFLATRLGHGTIVLNTPLPSSSPGSAASSQVGAAHLQAQPNVHTADPSRPIGRFSMAWFRRKARGKSDAAAPVRT